MDLGLNNKVALVAGASTGLGYAVARALALEGAQVVIASRSEERIQKAAETLAAETGSRVQGIALDVRDPDAGTRMVKAAKDAFGSPGILVTNAGGPPPGPFARFDVQHFEDALGLNFLPAVRLTRAALPEMKKNKWGRIVHIGSSTIAEPSVGLFLSSSVRPAVAGFSKALAKEVAADGITVNLVCPGVISTDRLSELAEYMAEETGKTVEEAFASMGAAVPAGRIGTPEEFGAAVAFLCSETSSYITGISLRVDGGKVSSLL